MAADDLLDETRGDAPGRGRLAGRRILVVGGGQEDYGLKPMVVHAVDELVRLGYARREPDPADGRAKLVTMTERGLQAERAGREAVARVRDAWAVALGEREMEQLEALLRRLRATLWPQAGSGATRS